MTVSQLELKVMHEQASLVSWKFSEKSRRPSDSLCISRQKHIKTKTAKWFHYKLYFTIIYTSLAIVNHVHQIKYSWKSEITKHVHGWYTFRDKINGYHSVFLLPGREVSTSADTASYNLLFFCMCLQASRHYKHCILQILSMLRHC